MSNIKDTLCGARWGYPLFNFASGEVRTCCRTQGELPTKEMLEELGEDVFLNTPYQKERRLEMLKGEKHPSCDSCWFLEEAGLYSPRKQSILLPMPWNFKYKDHDSIFLKEGANDIFNYETDETTTLNEIDASSNILKSTHPYMLEINLSNTCNMKCSYCSPRFSSRWLEDFVEIVDPNADKAELKKQFRRDIPGLWETFWKWFNNTIIKRACRVGIIGGEPLIDPKFSEFLDNLIESYNNCPIEKRANSGYKNSSGELMKDHTPVLWIVTNLNTPKKQWESFLEYLPQLCSIFRVEVHASCESLREKAEYIRYGLKWNRFEKNLRELCSLKLKNLSVGFQAATNSMSITSLTEFLEFAKSLHDEYEVPIMLKQNIVALPEYHHPLVLTPDFAPYVLDAILYLESVIDEMRWVDDEWGRWSSYVDFLQTIYEGIRTNQGEDIKWDYTVRAHFYHYFRKYDQMRNTNFLETFPEYADFYEMCKQKGDQV